MPRLHKSDLVAFHNLTQEFHLAEVIDYKSRDIFRTLSNIYDGASYQK